MNKSLVHQGSVLAFVAGIAASLALVALLLVPMRVVRADLPPRPTPQEPAPQAERGGDGGVASIELRVHFSRIEQAYRWQTYWTVVEWQDAFGGWHEVEGWRGTLDEIVSGEGRKVWWVYRRDLSTGPFRWTVYRNPSGGLVAHSKPFNLPDAVGQRVEVTVTLVPQ